MWSLTMTRQSDTQNIVVPDAPPIPGLTFRHWCGRSDYTHMKSIFDACKDVDGQRGRTEPICVRKPWRRRGLARALLVQSLLMFRAMGFDDTALGLDAHNPHHVLDLYESPGYTVVHKWTVCRKPLERSAAL
jgi:GNAT superfamily N-acetyltransferase